jgi:AcrR family transcriptional regulator
VVQIQSEPRTAAKRSEILRRAADLFRRKGFHGAGMREIARGLGMAPGALYYYFESKEDLLHSCHTITLDRLLQAAREIVASGDPADEKVRRLILAHLQAILGDLGGGFLHLEFQSLPAPLLEEVLRGRDSYERIIRRLLRDGIRDGAFRRIDPKLAALSLLGALNWTAVWWRPEGRTRVEDVAEGIASAFLKGIGR